MPPHWRAWHPPLSLVHTGRKIRRACRSVTGSRFRRSWASVMHRRPARLNRLWGISNALLFLPSSSLPSVTPPPQPSHGAPPSGNPTWSRTRSGDPSRATVSSRYQPRYTALQAPGDPCPSYAISCCSTILYTLALRRVKTRLVLRSRSRRPSRISVLGSAARVSRRWASWRGQFRSFVLCVPRLWASRRGERGTVNARLRIAGRGGSRWGA